MDIIIQDCISSLSEHYEDKKNRIKEEYETWLEQEKARFSVYKQEQIEHYMSLLFESTENKEIMSFLQTMMEAHRHHENVIEDKFRMYQHNMNRIEMIYHHVQNELDTVKEKESSWFGFFEESDSDES